MTLGTAPRLATDPLIDDPRTRIVVCCGAGGVGKTTTAAALGVRAAERGRRTVVLTIDPARRLAQSMGLTSLDNTPRRVPGIDTSAGGALDAMMLDMKRTFDEIVEAHAEPDRARAILENPFYQSLSAGFAGTQEYMAMEKLGQLSADGTWDLIIVDTPPSRSALDFLDAPKRMGSFLDGTFIRLLTAPAKVGGRAGLKVVNLGMAGLSMLTGTLNKLLGAALLRDVRDFVTAMDTMFGGFRSRADATYRLLQAPGTSFLVVAAPERDAMREASYFVERLAADRMPLAGLVLNRVHGSQASQLSAERALAAAEFLLDAHGQDAPAEDAPAGDAASSGAPVDDVAPEDAASGAAPRGDTTPHVDTDESTTGPIAPERLAAGLLRLHAERMQLLARERRTHDRFTALHPDVPVAEVPALPEDVHDLDGLRDIGARLARFAETSSTAPTPTTSAGERRGGDGDAGDEATADADARPD